MRSDLGGGIEERVDTINVNQAPHTVITYDGIATVTTVTAGGRTLVDTLDAAAGGRLEETEVVGLEPVRFGYDGAGRLATVAQGQGADERIVAFRYDALGRLDEIEDPLGRVVGFDL